MRLLKLSVILVSSKEATLPQSAQGTKCMVPARSEPNSFGHLSLRWLLKLQTLVDIKVTSYKLSAVRFQPNPGYFYMFINTWQFQNSCQSIQHPSVATYRQVGRGINMAKIITESQLRNFRCERAKMVHFFIKLVVVLSTAKNMFKKNLHVVQRRFSFLM